MEIVHPPRRERDRLDQDKHQGDDYMADLRPLLEEDTPHGADRPRAQKPGDLFALREENARLRGLVVKLSNIIIKSIAEQK